jgi:2'-5' RNA ligase
VGVYVLSMVEASVSDLAWIESIRRLHDPQHAFVGAHVTLVFGFDVPTPASVLPHIRIVAAGWNAFAYRLTEARPVRDASGEHSHVFLTPGPGAESIVALHDDLHSGPLASALREDIAFVPHVTVARFAEHASAERLARELTNRGASIDGELRRLDVVAFDGKVLQPLEIIPLGQA